jgi:hypothetical protein
VQWLGLMDDAHPSELAGVASGSTWEEEECAIRHVGKASFYNGTVNSLQYGSENYGVFTQPSLQRSNINKILHTVLKLYEICDPDKIKVDNSKLNTFFCF